MEQSIITLLNHIVSGGDIACYHRTIETIQTWDSLNSESVTIDIYQCRETDESNYYTMIGIAGLEFDVDNEDLDSDVRYRKLKESWVPAPILFRSLPELFVGLVETGETSPVNAGTKYELYGLQWKYDHIDREAANWILYQIENQGRKV